MNVFSGIDKQLDVGDQGGHEIKIQLNRDLNGFKAFAGKICRVLPFNNEVAFTCFRILFCNFSF